MNYKPVIDYIKKIKGKIILDQKLAKRLTNSEFPKSFFNLNYIMNGRNELSRYIIESDKYIIDVVPAHVILKEK